MSTFKFVKPPAKPSRWREAETAILRMGARQLEPDPEWLAFLAQQEEARKARLASRRPGRDVYLGALLHRGATSRGLVKCRSDGTEWDHN